MICFVTSRLDVIACVIVSVSDVSSVLDDPLAVVAAAVTSTIRVVTVFVIVVATAGDATAGLTHMRHLVGQHKIMLQRQAKIVCKIHLLVRSQTTTKVHFITLRLFSYNLPMM